jgi:hypothetical protein
LEKWQVDYRHWWKNQSNPRIPPLQRQKEYPQQTSFLEEWASLRRLMRGLQKDLIRVYDLVDIKK